MSTVPDPAGLIAVIEVALLTVYEDAEVPPNLTEVAPLKPVPVIATEVPPAVGPEVGDLLVTAGIAA